MKKQIPLREIRIDGGTQQRPIDITVVARYAELMRDDVVFPPVDIVFDGKNHWLYNGFHRFFATKKLDRKTISAEINEGTQRDAIWISFSENKDHGFPRQPGTGKEIIIKIFADKEWAKTSQVDIAKWVGVTEGYVRKVKTEIEAHHRTGTKIEPHSKPEKKVLRSKTLKVERKGQEYEMNVKSKPKVLDSTGKEVPKHLEDVFRRVGEFKENVAALQAMLRTAKDGIEAGDKLYAFIKIENLQSAI